MKRVTTTLFAITLFLNTALAQERSMDEVYSMMVFNFTKYVQWPDYAESGEFVIGVIGNNQVFSTLHESYHGKPRGKKTYVIKKFSGASDVTDCHVLFIDRSKSNEFETVNAKIQGKPTLLITDKNGLGAKGSGINFKTVDNKLKFELNQKVLESSNLKVSSTLSSMAISI